MSGRGRCRDCQAPVLWLSTSYGRAMPVDPEPNPHGNVIVVLNEAMVIPPDHPSTRPRYMPHFASCAAVQHEPLPGF